MLFRSFLLSWRKSLLATTSYIAGAFFLTPALLSLILDTSYSIMTLETMFLGVGSLIPLTLVHPRSAPQKNR